MEVTDQFSNCPLSVADPGLGPKRPAPPFSKKITSVTYDELAD